jgi:hypothetical protein
MLDRIRDEFKPLPEIRMDRVILTAWLHHISNWYCHYLIQCQQLLSALQCNFNMEMSHPNLFLALRSILVPVILHPAQLCAKLPRCAARHAKKHTLMYNMWYHILAFAGNFSTLCVREDRPSSIVPSSLWLLNSSGTRRSYTVQLPQRCIVPVYP